MTPSPNSAVPGIEPAQPDPVLAAAVDIAYAAATEEAGPEPVGGHVGVEAETGGAATHLFETNLAGYQGWRWAVTVASAGPGTQVTVSEVVLLPGPDALVAPEWVPWQQRVQAGDLGVGDLMPTAPGDPRLVPAYLESDDPAIEDVATDVGLGRVRVMSRFGRLDSAERWHTGQFGPHTEMARSAPHRCGRCGFYLPLAGSMRAAFGVCGNELSPADGHAVHVEYGCGAHSEVELELVSPVPVADLVYDDTTMDIEPMLSAHPDPIPATATTAEPIAPEPAVVTESAVVEPTTETAAPEKLVVTESAVGEAMAEPAESVAEPIAAAAELVVTESAAAEALAAPAESVAEPTTSAAEPVVGESGAAVAEPIAAAEPEPAEAIATAPEVAAEPADAAEPVEAVDLVVEPEPAEPIAAAPEVIAEPAAATESEAAAAESIAAPEPEPVEATAATPETAVEPGVTAEPAVIAESVVEPEPAEPTAPELVVATESEAAAAEFVVAESIAVAEPEPAQPAEPTVAAPEVAAESVVVAEPGVATAPEVAAAVFESAESAAAPEIAVEPVVAAEPIAAAPELVREPAVADSVAAPEIEAEPVAAESGGSVVVVEGVDVAGSVVDVEPVIEDDPVVAELPAPPVEGD